MQASWTQLAGAQDQDRAAADSYAGVFLGQEPEPVTRPLARPRPLLVWRVGAPDSAPRAPAPRTTPRWLGPLPGPTRPREFLA